jgi:Flp pilus assembly protein TadD
MAWWLIALTFFFVAVASEPAAGQTGEAAVFVGRAVVMYEEERYEDALAELQEALRLDPTNVDALFYTGLVNIALKRYDAAVDALEQARRRSPRDTSILFQLGALYFGLSRYDQAQPLLEEVFAANPKLDSVGYYVGFIRYRNKNYQGALRAFRAGASADPDIQQLTRFYSGLALGVLGLPGQAAAEIEEALRLRPASPLTGPAERLLGAVAAAPARERRFRADVRVGFFYDDNVPVIPNASTGDLLVAALRQGDPESTGELASVRFDYSFLRLGAFDATATFAFFTTYNNDLPSFNVVDYLGGLGLSYKGTVGSLPYRVDLQYTYDYLTIDGAEFVQRHTVTPSATIILDSLNLTALQLRLQNKEYSHDTNIPREEKRDANNYMAGFVHLFRFAADRHFLKVGYQFDYEDTEGPNRRGLDFAYSGNRVLAGAQYTLPWYGIRLNYDFDVHLRNYLHRHVFLPVQAPNTKERFDTEYNHFLSVTIPLPRSLSLSVTYQAIVANSNIDVFSYRRNVVTALIGWTY